MAVRRLLSSTRKVFALIGTIAMLTAGGGSVIWKNYHEVSKVAPWQHSFRQRESFIALGDLIRLSEDARIAADAEKMLPAHRRAVSEAVDFLYVRTEAFRQMVGEAPPPEALEVLARLQDVIMLGDRIVKDELADIDLLGAEMPALVRRANSALVRYIDLQYRTQNQTYARQTKRLTDLSVSAGALLIFFAMISSYAIIILQRELLAKREWKSAEDQANYLAYFDPLTGLANRTQFQSHVAQMLEVGSNAVLMLLDVDQFKSVNDVHGHALGDEVLRAIAQHLTLAVMTFDGMAARLGGDEFCIILPGDFSAAQVSDLCTKLLEDVRLPVVHETQSVSPRISLGAVFVDELPPAERRQYGQVMRAADFALYEAKAAGRGTFRFYDKNLAAILEERSRFLEEIPRALANGEFLLEYQPQVHLASRTVFGFEALVRWRRDGKVLPPIRFLPVAESSGLIIGLDIWVLHTATAKAAEWGKKSGKTISISVNLSPLHFRTDRIVREVRRALDRSGLDPALLTLEVTETVLIEDWGKVTELLAKLHGLGVKISLDDFGTGYSSLAYLRRMTVDEVKIDRSFLSEIEVSSQTQFMLDALVDIAQGLGMRLLVEGVETSAQAEIVQKLGCYSGQGFYFGMPMSDVDAWEVISNQQLGVQESPFKARQRPRR